MQESSTKTNWQQERGRSSGLDNPLSYRDKRNIIFALKGKNDIITQLINKMSIKCIRKGVVIRREITTTEGLKWKKGLFWQNRRYGHKCQC